MQRRQAQVEAQKVQDSSLVPPLLMCSLQTVKQPGPSPVNAEGERVRAMDNKELLNKIISAAPATKEVAQKGREFVAAMQHYREMLNRGAAVYQRDPTYLPTFDSIPGYAPFL